MESSGPIWKKIASALAAEIDDRSLPPGGRLPADTELAVRFAANRHTVRRALQDLQAQGLLRVERGRGTFVADDVHDYSVGGRMRFTENILAADKVPGRWLLQVAEVPAPQDVAAHLRMRERAEAVLAVVVGYIDGRPVWHGRAWFPRSRLPGLADYLRGFVAPPPEGGAEMAPPSRLSFTKALQHCGIGDYRRQKTWIVSREADEEERRRLRMPSAENVLETEGIDVASGTSTPVLYSRTAFRSSRIRLLVESQDGRIPGGRS